MLYGRGYGFSVGGGWGRGGGRGFGFMGASAPWPYIGRGRGGLPRCGYYLANPALIPPYYNYAAQAAPENPAALKNMADSIKDTLAQIQARISELEQQKSV